MYNMSAYCRTDVMKSGEFSTVVPMQQDEQFSCFKSDHCSPKPGVSSHVVQSHQRCHLQHYMNELLTEGVDLSAL